MIEPCQYKLKTHTETVKGTVSCVLEIGPTYSRYWDMPEGWVVM